MLTTVDWFFKMGKNFLYFLLTFLTKFAFNSINERSKNILRKHIANKKLFLAHSIFLRKKKKIKNCRK